MFGTITLDDMTIVDAPFGVQLAPVGEIPLDGATVTTFVSENCIYYAKVDGIGEQFWMGYQLPKTAQFVHWIRTSLGM